MNKRSPKKLANILHVDAVLKSKRYLSQPYKDLNLLELVVQQKYSSMKSNVANQISITLKLLDGNNNKLIWEFAREVTNNNSSSATDFA